MPRNRELVFSVTIKDCDVQVFSAGGKGGQHQNKTASGVRVIHRPSGARGEAREERSQLQNKRKAFRRMAESPEFQKWARAQAATQSGAIDEWMQPHNILTETYDPNA